jgi:membrane-bound ClpP family serine protease
MTRFACLLAGLSAGLFTGSAVAQEVIGQPGLLVVVPSPLDSNAVGRIKGRVEAAMTKTDDRPTKVVFDFTPAGKDADSREFGPCYDLAELIAKWKDVNTVAFVTRKATGHLVLPILCCNELVMGDAAKVGEVVAAGDPPLTGLKANAYKDLVEKAKPGAAAAVRKMYDPGVRLAKGTKGGAGVWMVDLREKAAQPKDVIVDPAPVVDAGVVGLFTSKQMLDFDLRKAAANTVAELADLYGITPGSLRDDPLAGRAPIAFRIQIRDEIDQAVRESIARSVREVVRQNGNIVFLQLECDGGDLTAARELADDLIAFQHPEKGDGVRIVAFIPNSAANTAAVIAMGCTEIVMSSHKAAGPDAAEGVFGDFEGYLKKPGQNPDLIGRMLVDLAERQKLPHPLLYEGMVNKDLTILKVRSNTDRRKESLMTPEQLKANPDWASAGTLKKPGEYLKLPASQAKAYGLVAHVLDGTDPAELYQRYALEPGKVKDATPAWLDRFRNFLREPSVTAILVLVGFIGLILELKVPGTTVPGIVAALCFIMVFWAWTGFSGQLAVLAGLLFLLGLVLILLEVFVLPGFGVAGIIGIVLMIASLALVTVDKIPESGGDWMRLGGQMAKLMFLMIGGLVGAFLIARYLPKVPVANRMVLAPTAEREATDPTVLPGAAQAANLLGAIGVASTVLRPAGTVQFGDEYVDVVSDGGFIPAGTRVQVVEVEGTRIVVKEV